MVYDYEELSSFVQLRTSMTEELSVSIWCQRLWKISWLRYREPGRGEWPMRTEKGPTHINNPEMYTNGSRKKYRRLRRAIMTATSRRLSDDSFAGLSLLRHRVTPDCRLGDGGGLGELLLPPPPPLASLARPFPPALGFIAKFSLQKIERERENDLIAVESEDENENGVRYVTWVCVCELRRFLLRCLKSDFFVLYKKRERVCVKRVREVSELLWCRKMRSSVREEGKTKRDWYNYRVKIHLLLIISRNQIYLPIFRILIDIIIFCKFSFQI